MLKRDRLFLRPLWCSTLSLDLWIGAALLNGHAGKEGWWTVLCVTLGELVGRWPILGV